MILGAHNSIAGGLHLAVEEAKLVGGETMQIFCKNQRQWKAKPLTEEQITLFKDAVSEAKLGPIMVHDSYLINMGTPDDAKRANATAAFVGELERCVQLGVEYLNFHPGSHTHPSKPMRDDKATRFDCLDRIAQCVNAALDEVPGITKAVIENAAGQGTNVGTSWEEVGHLADQIDGSRLGICVDTQHSWAAGHDWLEAYDEVWEEFDDQVGLDRLVAFHLNDSKQPLGARVDRHDSIPEGALGEPFWKRLMTDARFTDKAGYLETPSGVDGWKQELTYLRSLQG